MFLNIVIGFVIPWVFGIYLYKMAPKILLSIFSLGTVLSHIINAFADEYKMWHLLPEKYLSIDYLMFDIGLYAILPSYMIFFIYRYKQINGYIFVLIFTIITTILEFFWFKIGRVTYHNGWSIYHTFFSYLIPYFLIFMYFKLLRKVKFY
ncbi:MAG: hypothetical protein FH762_00020 [Firmicutes bacterium]|nr:hypothetical protein [Bacillota bacterium]